MARTRFDQQASTSCVGGAGLEDENGDMSEINAALGSSASKNPRTRQYVDTSVDPRRAIAKIQLPAATMYLIDKVVRSKALQGPIGIDNSEVINLETEKELQKRNQYLANLAGIKGSDQNSDDEEDLDGDDFDMNEQQRENLANEKLLKRLYKVAERDIQQ